MSSSVIASFVGEYRFLSNFYPAQINYKGEIYRTVEHAYQAAKTTTDFDRFMVSWQLTPSKAKSVARTLTLREDWDEIKNSVMLDLLRLKFNIPDLKLLLLQTDKAILIEGNTWGDIYWGMCKGRGKNMLGNLLMQVRAELKEQP